MRRTAILVLTLVAMSMFAGQAQAAKCKKCKHKKCQTCATSVDTVSAATICVFTPGGMAMASSIA